MEENNQQSGRIVTLGRYQAELTKDGGLILGNRNFFIDFNEDERYQLYLALREVYEPQQ